MKTIDWDQLREEHEIAFLKADICLGSPESFNLAEKRQICEQMEASSVEIEEVIRKDFHSMPEYAQRRMLELLAGADPANYDWWLNLLYHAER